MKLNTPCIGICSTVYGDDICRGCKRTYAEIIAWNTYQEEEKQRIFHRLASDIVTVMKNKIKITNIHALVVQLHEHAIRYRENDHPLCWAYHLLRVAYDKIPALPNCGLNTYSMYQNYTLRQLFTLIDAEILQLAKHHFSNLMSVDG